MESTARVATERPARYIKQLAQHFGNRIETEYSDEGGTLNFAYGRCELLAEEGAIVLRAEAEDDESLTRVEDVTGRHLERFLGQGGRAERDHRGGGRTGGTPGRSLGEGGQNEPTVAWRRA